MKTPRAVLLLLLTVAVPAEVAAQPRAYYPPRADWQTRRPEQVGMDAARLDAAIKFAIASENPATKDLAVDLPTTFGREPFDTPIGPVKPRGAAERPDHPPRLRRRRMG